MKKIITLLLLAVAFASCKNELAIEVDQVPETARNTVSITVGAGLGDAQTKSTVEYSNGVRTLKFTDGDKLYVRAVIEMEEDPLFVPQETKIMAGLLDIASIDASGTIATFTGDLDVFDGTIVEVGYDQIEVEIEPERDEWEEVGWDSELNEPVYDWVHYDAVTEWQDDYTSPNEYGIVNYEAGSYDFGGSADPLADCVYAFAILVHKDAGTNFIIDDYDKTGCYNSGDASDVATLMTTMLVVEGDYESANHSFVLSAEDEQSIMNCTISGLTPDATYDVRYFCGEYSFEDNSYDLSAVTADAQGKVAFSFFGYSACNCYHAIRFINVANRSEWKLVELGQKTLGNKVYNVTKTAVDDPAAPTVPTLSRSDGFNADELVLDAPGEYIIRGTCIDQYLEEYEYDVNLTISGDSDRYYFRIYDGGTVTLAGNGTATGIDCDYIYAYGTLTIMLNSDYTIVTDYDEAIGTSGDLYLGVSTTPKTLTVTVNGDTYKGLSGSNYYRYDHYDDLNGEDVYVLEEPSVLAIPGCSVVLTSETNNGNGTWTYVYTVSRNLA